MALPFVFATQAAGNVPGAELDTNFSSVANMAAFTCTATGTNSITLSPAANQPDVVAYVNGQKYQFLAAANSTGSVQMQVGSLSLLNVYRQDSVAAGSGDLIASGLYVATYYTALNAGLGGFQLAQTPTIPTIANGPYTPTITPIAGITGTPTTGIWNYQRFGSTVWVWGQITIQFSGATNWSLGATLPIPSNIGAASDLGGSGFSHTGNINGCGIEGDATNDRASFQSVASGAVTNIFDFNFIYKII